MLRGMVPVPLSIQHQRSANRTLRIVCPNGHLGFAPIKTGSFQIGLAAEPDLICADSGSCDVGPGPLDADTSSSPRQWQVDDLERQSRRRRYLRQPAIWPVVGNRGARGLRPQSPRPASGRGRDPRIGAVPGERRPGAMQASAQQALDHPRLAAGRRSR